MMRGQEGASVARNNGSRARRCKGAMMRGQEGASVARNNGSRARRCKGARAQE